MAPAAQAAAPAVPGGRTGLGRARGDVPVNAPVGDETSVSPVPGSAAPAAASSDELTRTLASLADLRDRGAISVDEYERKKAEILGRL